MSATARASVAWRISATTRTAAPPKSGRNCRYRPTAVGSELAPSRSRVQSTTSWKAQSMASGSVSHRERNGRSSHSDGDGDVPTRPTIPRSPHPSTRSIPCIAGPWNSTRP